MTRLVRQVDPGRSPRLLVPPAQRVEKVEVEVVRYGGGEVTESAVGSIDEIPDAGDDRSVTWINVVGLHDVQLLQRLAERFGIHDLALEDIVGVGQRPGYWDFDDHLFVVMRQLHIGRTLDVEQVSLVLRRGVVITLQEIPDDDLFEPVRERIRRGGSNLHANGADYLAYALIDCLVDGLYPILETYGEAIEVLETQLLADTIPDLLVRIQRIKRDLLWMRRTAWPHREVVHGLERLETDLITDGTRRFLRDSYDHAVQIMDVVDTFHEMANGLSELYLSTASNRMNEVMKVLTIMASIFIPLTFIAGIYGMNFNPELSPLNMPELNWFWGYPFALTLMGGIAAVMLYLFRRKRWL